MNVNMITHMSMNMKMKMNIDIHMNIQRDPKHPVHNCNHVWNRLGASWNPPKPSNNVHVSPKKCFKSPSLASKTPKSGHEDGPKKTFSDGYKHI